jgi:sulfate adenylyltransferase subunit 1
MAPTQWKTRKRRGTSKMVDNTEILRFATAGSVDDGKSTLIGRLLYDSKEIFLDQLEALEEDSKSKNLDTIDLAHLTDGLKDEREQGITIDVAYRYFSTPKRKFIIADTPGHEEYTRNMFTGASNSSLAIILIDSRKGVLRQSRRHLYISYLLGIKNIIVAVNKMDLVNYSREKFLSIRQDFKEISKDLSIESINFVPLSALNGDMIVRRGTNLPWYKGETLISLLENVNLKKESNTGQNCFPVQLISRVDNEDVKDFRGYMGTVTSGRFKIGEKIKVLPSKKESVIKNILVSDSYSEEINKNQSGTILLEDEIEISRGDLIANVEYYPRTSSVINCQVCWMSNEALVLDKKYLIKHSNKISKAIVTKIINKVDIESLKETDSSNSLEMNDIGKVEIKIQNQIVNDSYESNRNLGSLIIIDIESNNTVGAGIIE